MTTSAVSWARRRAAVDGNPHVGLRQGRRVVDAVADHRHLVALRLQLLDRGQLVAGEDLGHIALDAQLPGHGLCHRRTVAGQHDDLLDAVPAQGVNHCAASGRMGSARPSRPDQRAVDGNAQGRCGVGLRSGPGPAGPRASKQMPCASRKRRLPTSTSHGADVRKHALADLVVEVSSLRDGQPALAGGLDYGLGHRVGQEALGGRSQRHDLVQVCGPG